MKPRLAAAALRNYASPVFVRENPMLASASCMLAAGAMSAPKAAATVAIGGIEALFLHRSMFLFFWWYVAFYVPACFMVHYWRQVRSNLATAIPDLKLAEFSAVAIILVILTALFATPLIGFGAPIAGALALAALAMATGGAFSSAGATGQAKGIARLRGLLFLPVMFIGSQPHYLSYVVFAPVPVALLIAGLAVSLAVSGLRYFPARAAREDEAQADRADRAAAAPRAGALRMILRPIGQIMTWKPGFMPVQPVPAMLGIALGPIGLLIVTCIQIGVLLLYIPAFAWITGHGFMAALIKQAPLSIGFGVALGLFGSGQWLISRGDWPALYMAGRYGGRSGFAAAMVRAFRTNTIEIGLINAIVVTVVALSLGIVKPIQAIPVALCTFGAMFGASHLPSIPLLWRELGGKGVTLLFAMVGAFAVMALLGFGVLDHGPALWAGGCAAVLFGLGIIMSRLAPGRLAAMDWPIETDPAG
ncbi:hypothetical protein AruPA_00410 [Acidiphilium sp. PA]|uniref:hypothetical protein n=1 Tax=Acidiphilium sp. PA TaxID=2871705 RepID=UPI002243ED20|nr:hypothetical protein [Acidiphilium sp. PA]MCW8305483.1 hypothetical protein [Acidiphilium sp. PA]